MKYVVSLKRINTAKIIVEADSREDALEKASQACREDDFAWQSELYEYQHVKEQKEKEVW